MLYVTPHLFPRTTAPLVVRLVPAGPHASASPQRRGGGGGSARDVIGCVLPGAAGAWRQSRASHEPRSQRRRRTV